MHAWLFQLAASDVLDFIFLFWRCFTAHALPYTMTQDFIFGSEEASLMRGERSSQSYRNPSFFFQSFLSVRFFVCTCQQLCLLLQLGGANLHLLGFTSANRSHSTLHVRRACGVLWALFKNLTWWQPESSYRGLLRSPRPVGDLRVMWSMAEPWRQK